MPLAVKHPRLSSDEYEALQAKAGWTAPVELIGGEPVVTLPTAVRVSSVRGELFYVLRGWASPGRGGLTLQNVFVRISEGTFLAPAVAWWSDSRRPSVGPGPIDTVPDLVIEVLAPSSRDNVLGPKCALYVAAGVNEIWVADPHATQITVVSGGGERVFARGEVLRSALLPGLAVGLEAVFGQR